MKKLYISLVAVLVSFTMSGQIMLDSSFTLSGSADVYFRSNLGAKNYVGDEFQAPESSFANLPGFSLGMFNVIGSYESEKFGFVGDLVFGPRGADAVFGSPPALNIVNQLYGYYNISDAVKVTLGNFNTFLGYEVISPAVNFNYSTSYLFSYGPFSHTGLKLNVDLGGGFGLMGSIMNPTDATDFNPNGDIFFGGQLGYAGDKGFAYLNLLAGPDYTQVDLTAGTNITESFYLGVNASTAVDLFTGGAIYAQIATSESFGLGLRAEYFVDHGLDLIGGSTTESQNVVAVTLSGNYKVGNFTLIPEFRIDAYSQDPHIVVSETSTTNILPSFVLAAVYSF